MKTVGRNDPCPCRSGKKHKHCCLLGVPAARALGLNDTLQLAIGFFETGQLQQAAALSEQILQVDPTQADALHLLGVTAREAGDTSAALDNLTRATRSRPQFPLAHYHLGLLHMQQGRLEQAALHYRQAIEAAPNFLEAHANLGMVLNRLGDPRQALIIYQDAMAIHEAVEVKIGVAECLQRMRLGPAQAHLSPLLTRAIIEAWRRPEELASSAIALLMCDPHLQEALVQMAMKEVRTFSAGHQNTLLLHLLESATVTDAALEGWLTAARAAMLDEALKQAVPEDASLEFRAALARQCFINEYAWIVSARETNQVRLLEEQVNAVLEAGGLPSAHAMLAFACYHPLHTLSFVDTLLQDFWPDAVRAVLRQQIEEVRQEAQWRATVPRLTAIDEDTSCRVQQQYEENPYPRWTRSSLFPAPLSLDDRIRTQVPNARFRPLGQRDAIDILVAGCGTGRHSTETASHYRGARVLAIDLSASSLGYAMRKSHELGQCHIEYAQADILQLATLDRRFDLIEAVGVLHHLADPESGWRALLPLLQPGGIMLIGLYSGIARAPVAAARRFISERGFPASAGGIRQCRKAFMDWDCPDALRQLTAFGDFYGVSACRDLLFHAQEHHTTLPAIGALLDRFGLDFVGLRVEPAVLHRFRARFPDECAVHDLNLWHQYETENPETFIGMYQFWVQKRTG